jgi:bifunctional non-homologous end joining protein LigD
VIHKHAASRLHYDLRLEAGGGMRSWAVPKGPSLDPAQKRLAIEVEPHPVAYNSFEGVIPEGYGAGTVMVWDSGVWELAPDPKAPSRGAEEALASGGMKFILHGKKLKGQWRLFRLHGRGGEGKEWLLSKSADEFADAGRDILADEPDSAKTGRTMDEITASRELYDGSCGEPR